MSTHKGHYILIYKVPELPTLWQPMLYYYGSTTCTPVRHDGEGSPQSKTGPVADRKNIGLKHRGIAKIGHTRPDIIIQRCINCCRQGKAFPLLDVSA